MDKVSNSHNFNKDLTGLNFFGGVLTHPLARSLDLRLTERQTLTYIVTL